MITLSVYFRCSKAVVDLRASAGCRHFIYFSKMCFSRDANGNVLAPKVKPNKHKDELCPGCDWLPAGHLSPKLEQMINETKSCRNQRL